MELNDSSELESNLHGMSLRSAASPAADSRRFSSGSLMSVVSEVSSCLLFDLGDFILLKLSCIGLYF